MIKHIIQAIRKFFAKKEKKRILVTRKEWYQLFLDGKDEPFKYDFID